MPPLNILVLEDNPLDTELMLRELRRVGLEPDWLRVDNEKDYLSHLHPGLDLILSDYQMPQFNGLHALELLRERGWDIPFILISGTIGEDTAVEAMKQGATDYLLKDGLSRLGASIQHALEESHLRKERKAATEKLRLRETALNAVSQGVLISDENRLIIYANTSFTELSGYAESEILGRNCAFLQGPDTDPETVLKIRASLSSGRPFEGEILNYRKDGEPFWNELSIAPLRGEEGGRLRFIGIQRDITARKRAEEALRRKETELRVLFDLMPAMIWFKDTKNNHLRVNKHAALSIGKSVEELEGKPCAEHYPLDAEGFYAADLEVMRSGMPKLGIVETIRDGENQDLWLQTDKVPYCDEHGKVIGIVVMSQNITARKQAEQHLAANEALLRQFIQHTPAAIAMLDLQMRYLQVSERWMQDYHLADRNIIGKSHYEIFPDAPPHWKDIHQRVLSGAVESCEEDPFPRTDGTTDWLQWEARPWRKAGGEIGGLIFFTQVITERKKAEMEIRFNEQRYRSLVEASTAIVWDTPASGEFEVDQPSWKAFTGQSFEELRGWGWLKAIHPDDKAETARAWSEAVKNRTAYEVEHRLRGADHTYRNMTVRAVPILAEDGTIRQWIGVHIDITERKKAQQALGVALERLQIAVKAGKAGTWDLDLLTGRVDWDEQMLTLYGKLADTVEPGTERWYGAIHPEDLADVQSTHKTALQGEGDTFDTEFRIHRGDDGSLRFIRAMGVVLRNESGEPVRMTGINLDITEQRNREEKLAAALAKEKELSEKARAGDRAKSEFLAVMSHEVRTPMNGIIGFAELLVQAGLSPECHAYAQTIAQSGEALTHVLDDILDFSRLEAGGLKVTSEVFAPRILLQDIQRLMAHQAAEKNVAVHLSVADSIPDHLRGDTGRLRQILLNLVGNAIKFTQRGTIGITLMPLLEQPSTFVFAIKDTGVGITPEQIGRIFQPFTQADSSISRKYGGTGLGLTISRRLAELLGGKLSVKSQPGMGSEFFLTLPLAIAAGPREALSTALPESLDASFATRHPLRLLVVEDDRVNLKLIKVLLRRLGYAPLSAKNGREAVKISGRENLDCILMDLQMPEMDGIEASLAIRSLEKNADRAPVFISALTANIFPADRQRCLEAGMEAYLNKPVKFAALAETLVKASDARARLVSPDGYPECP